VSRSVAAQVGSESDSLEHTSFIISASSAETGAKAEAQSLLRIHADAFLSL